ncbi:MAG: NAD(P)/FAD-dependent oxidoreductase [Verrucomicrobiota bacterium]
MTDTVTTYDAVVVGSGPNGLSAAVTLAREGASVLVLEGHEKPGGGTRTTELTLPGFKHDVCSAVHPMAMASPFFKTIDWAKHGVDWKHADVPLAHPLEGGDAAALHRSVEKTAAGLGEDGAAYRRIFEPLTRDAAKLYEDLLGPFRIPRHPFAMSRFGLPALLPATRFARRFKTEKARALFAGNAAHSIQPLENLTTSAIGIMLMVSGHAVDWPVPEGGSQSIARALLAELESLGGEVKCGVDVRNFSELPKAKAVLFDTSPSAMASICGDKLPEAYRQRLGRYRHGPGIFKLDWALSEPIPWKAEACRQACTVHVGGTLEEMAISERDCWEERHSGNPFVLVAQQSLMDSTRAPEGKHTGWAYMHVPAGSTQDMTEVIEKQIERFAPGFRDCILETHSMNCEDYETYNPNFIGGDIICGVQDWRQLYTRPVARLNPYTTPVKDVFICSSATPPGGGVHGMCGYWAAKAAMRTLR